MFVQPEKKKIGIVHQQSSWCGFLNETCTVQQRWALSVFFNFFTNKKWFFCIFSKVNNLFLHQSHLKSPLPVKLTWQNMQKIIFYYSTSVRSLSEVMAFTMYTLFYKLLIKDNWLFNSLSLFVTRSRECYSLNRLCSNTVLPLFYHWWLAHLLI